MAALSAGFIAQLLGVLAVLLGCQPIDSRVEPIVGGGVSPGSAVTGSVDECRPVGRRRIAVSARVQAVDRGLLVAGRRVARLSEAVAPLCGPITGISGRDELANLRVTLVTDTVPLVGNLVATVSGRIALVGDAIALVGDSLPFIRHTGFPSFSGVRS